MFKWLLPLLLSACVSGEAERFPDYRYNRYIIMEEDGSCHALRAVTGGVKLRCPGAYELLVSYCPKASPGITEVWATPETYNTIYLVELESCEL